MQESYSTWEEFERRLRVLDRWRRRISRNRGGRHRYWLFRGHSRSSWTLSTTLDRVISDTMPLSEYFQIVWRMKSEIESLTNRQWKLPDPPDYFSVIAEAGQLPLIPHPDDLYEYLVYLRHHGFPSPLLDWTRSPYIAAYFAYKDATPDDDVAIFAYMERPTGMKIGDIDSPRIEGRGPFVKAHPRHHLQQAEYTICIQPTDNGLTYASHDSVFSEPKEGQDLLCKFVLPVSERIEILKKLHQLTLNSYTLFGSEESLIETLKLRHFVIEGYAP